MKKIEKKQIPCCWPEFSLSDNVVVVVGDVVVLASSLSSSIIDGAIDCSTTTKKKHKFQLIIIQFYICLFLTLD